MERLHLILQCCKTIILSISTEKLSLTFSNANFSVDNRGITLDNCTQWITDPFIYKGNNPFFAIKDLRIKAYTRYATGKQLINYNTNHCKLLNAKGT